MTHEVTNMSDSCFPADSSGTQTSVRQESSLNKCLDLRVPSQSVIRTTTGDRTPKINSIDPRLWKRVDVRSWLQWAVAFYQLDAFDVTSFAMNGRALCLLTRDGFMSRAPSCGDVLHGDFQRRYAGAVLASERERERKRKLHAAWHSGKEKAKEVKRAKAEVKGEEK